MVVLPTHLGRYLENLLQGKMHFGFRGLYSEARIGGKTVVSNLSFLYLALKEFECLSQPVEEDIVGVIWPLCLIGVLEV